MTEKDTDPVGTPRWVKVFGVIAIVAIALVVVMLIAGRGGHGPGRHAAALEGLGHRTGPSLYLTRQQP